MTVEILVVQLVNVMIERISYLKKQKNRIMTIEGKIKNDIRGFCNRNCVYSYNGRCDLWENFVMPEDVNECDNYKKLLK